MNLAIPHSAFLHTNVMFTEPKNNNIMDGQFTKILYSTEMYTMNEIYVILPLKAYRDNYSKSVVFFNIQNPVNQECIHLFTEIERAILDLYMKNTGSTKTPLYKLGEQLGSGTMNLYSVNYFGTNASGAKPTGLNPNTMSQLIHPKYTLKMSGIWETETEIGITYKVIETMYV